MYCLMGIWFKCSTRSLTVKKVWLMKCLPTHVGSEYAGSGTFFSCEEFQAQHLNRFGFSTDFRAF